MPSQNAFSSEEVGVKLMGRPALYGMLSSFTARMAVNPINGDEKDSPALAIRLARKFLGVKILADIFLSARRGPAIV